MFRAKTLTSPTIGHPLFIAADGQPTYVKYDGQHTIHSKDYPPPSAAVASKSSITIITTTDSDSEDLAHMPCTPTPRTEVWERLCKDTMDHYQNQRPRFPASYPLVHLEHHANHGDIVMVEYEEETEEVRYIATLRVAITHKFFFIQLNAYTINQRRFQAFHFIFPSLIVRIPSRLCKVPIPKELVEHYCPFIYKTVPVYNAPPTLTLWGSIISSV
ncbi:hypothetical protein JR316_0003282 [Psilocybe cubensis]|uniref:Uncharacterized protein n=1 Tax=Psilocybe cubensis TaxID=181762 RepID=A0ACB8H7K1_PSICU|nr:hypothetical protein JR316_0003282 [Psilocybe cubensis]KAH9483804.1 hypothetical protein JR316_0003282 [Psilocybe cubensis]